MGELRLILDTKENRSELGKKALQLKSTSSSAIPHEDRNGCNALLTGNVSSQGDRPRCGREHETLTVASSTTGNKRKRSELWREKGTITGAK